MAENKKITYIDTPDEKAFPNEDVAQLVNVLNNVDSVNSWARHQAARALGDPQNEDQFRAIVKLDPAHWPIESMLEIRNKGNTMIAKDGEKTVGMIGFEEHHRAPSGQRIFEIRRNTVLLEYRRRGIGKTLRENMIKRIQKIDPNALVISRIDKDNVANQNLSISTGSRKVSDSDMEKLGFSKEWIETRKERACEYYVHDLSKDSQ